MSFRALTAALDGHLASLFDVPPIAWPNVIFTPPDGIWIRPNNLTTDTEQPATGQAAKVRHAGIYQVDVFAPRGTGLGDAENLADDIAAHFKPRTVIGDIRIRAVSRGAALTEPNWTQLPINISWYAFTENWS